jgi:hypothetical protein
VITPEREYKNPFASPEPESAPAAESAKVETIPEPVAAAPVPEPPAAPEAPASPESEAEKHEIQILPPAEAIRPAVSWESPSASRGEQQRGERPTFRADRREDRPGASRPDGGDARHDGREFRRDPYRGQPRDPRDEPQYEQRPRGDRGAPVAPAAPEPRGFLGWLKSLFGGGKPAEAPAAREPDGERFNDGQRHRRRHRGGRGHGGSSQGMRGDRAPQGGERFPQGGENDSRGFDRQGGPRRRRHRGGQGRDRGGNPRSEGHQGGGAI